ncbi:hypothetical protein [Streptomyces sp. CBMA152]|uniref:hypothetical protein n=1 Tax=Streptomyces sp. CBMA152 TaxID=1896312 RepID=UPI0016608C50|nr:hypothetical protein [Streptomyces sp. CBMA152]MBD0743178.1 hypothetical protein [Streptomyces sp. CBMA152]
MLDGQRHYRVLADLFDADSLLLAVRLSMSSVCDCTSAATSASVKVAMGGRKDHGVIVRVTHRWQ